MRKVLVIAGLLSTFGFTVIAQKEQARSTLKVSGMSCTVCAARVEKTAKEIDGVKAVKVDQPNGTAEITYDPQKTSPEAVAAAITKKTPFKSDASKK